jgi:hypothetical protein
MVSLPVRKKTRGGGGAPEKIKQLPRARKRSMPWLNGKKTPTNDVVTRTMRPPKRYGASPSKSYFVWNANLINHPHRGAVVSGLSGEGRRSFFRTHRVNPPNTPRVMRRAGSEGRCTRLSIFR